MAIQRRAGRRPDYDWARIVDVQGVVIAAEASFLATATAFLTSGTLSRLRGRVFAQLDQGGLDERVSLHVGVGIFPTDMVAAGAAPEISVDGSVEEYAWIWTGMLFLSTLAEAAILPDALFDRLTIDSKAMRKFRPRDTLAVVLEAPSEGAVNAAGTVDVMVDLRLLIAS